MVLAAAELALKRFWFKYYCFSLFKANKINRILLWTLLPFSLLSYYYSDMQSDEAYQWYIYFCKKEFFTLALAVIIYNQFKGTRDATIATSVLLACIYNTIAELFGFHDKYAYIDVVWVVFMYALIIHSIYRYLANARNL